MLKTVLCALQTKEKHKKAIDLVRQLLSGDAYEHLD
jgi:hypothetical protein